MADILKDDVQTYVRKLISKVFESSKKENQACPDNGKLNQGDHKKQQKRPG